MIEVKYHGRLGNRLFQYSFGRILAEDLGFRLKVEPIPGFPGTKLDVDGHDYSGPAYPAQYISGHQVNMSSILGNRSARRIVVSGFFQRYEYYKKYKDLIRKKWLIADGETDKGINPGDIVVYVRRGDYIKRGFGLPFSYYEKALQMTGFERVYLCTDDPNDPFMALFKKYSPIIHHTPDDPFEDFRFIMAFNKIVQSASSFSWWASFLSSAGSLAGRLTSCSLPVSWRWSATASTIPSLFLIEYARI